MPQLALTAGLIALSLAWLAPGHYPPWPSFQAEFAAATGACLIGICAAVQPRTRWPWLAIVASATALVPIFQTAFGQIQFVSDGALCALYVVGFALSMAAGSTLIGEYRIRLLDGLCAAIAAAAVMSAGIAVMQWLGIGANLFITDMAPGQRSYANLAQPNHLATLLALGIVSVLRWSQMRRLTPFATAMAVAWLGWAMVLTQSRTGWVFAMMLMTWCVACGPRSGMRLKSRHVAAGALAYALGVMALPRINSAMSLAKTLALDQRLKPGVRIIHWQTFVDALWQSPWVGYGWSQVNLAQQAAATSHPFTGEMQFNSHDVLLDLLLWNGAPLGVLLIVALLVWIVRQVRACRTPDQWILLAAIGAVFEHALLEYPLNYAYFLLPTGLMMGALDGISDPKGGWSVPRWVFAWLLAMSAALLAFVGVEYAEVESAAWQVRMVSAGIGVDRVPTAPPAEVVLLDAPREYQRFAMSSARPGMTEAELDWMRRVSRRYPFASSMLRFATAAGLNGHANEASKTLDVLCKIQAADECDDARAAWLDLQQKYDVLRAVPLPEPAPAEAIRFKGPLRNAPS